MFFSTRSSRIVCFYCHSQINLVHSMRTKSYLTCQSVSILLKTQGDTKVGLPLGSRRPETPLVRCLNQWPHNITGTSVYSQSEKHHRCLPKSHRLSVTTPSPSFLKFLDIITRSSANVEHRGHHSNSANVEHRGHHSNHWSGTSGDLHYVDTTRMMCVQWGWEIPNLLPPFYSRTT